MLELTEKKTCSGCHACANACPKQCIWMKVDVEGFLYPEIDRTQCVDCHLCEKLCPILNGKCSNSQALQDTYAAYVKDDAVRKSSSSGGIFTLLAEQILDRGGVVFGAALADDCRSVRHIGIETKEQCTLLRGSKYVQSTIGTTYRDAKAFLDAGRPLLFTGTPCQIGGLYAFLQKDYDNLLTQDLICHGVPSPKVWDSYVQMREKLAGSKTKEISFRSKVTGWKAFSMVFAFENGTEYSASLREDPFMKGFLANLYLRPSCYACAFKTKQRQADLTLADFWGVQNVLPELDDNLGTSVIWLHSEKGREVFQQIQPQIRCEKIDIGRVLVYNNAAVSSVQKPSRRKHFWMTYRDAFPVDEVVHLSKRTFPQRVKRYFSLLKRKIMS